MLPQIYTVVLESKKEVARNTVEFTFTRPEGFIFEPGQHVEITLVDPATIDNSGSKRDFSLVSAPGESNLIIVARIRDSAFKRVLNSLAGGQTVVLRGPLGVSFRLHVATTRPAIFIAGGIGIAPFMSMMRYVFDDKLPYEMYLFYSNRRPETTIYHGELAGYASRYPQFKYIPTMTNMKQSTERWNGEEGRLSKEMIEKYLDAVESSVFYVAGPTSMVAGIDQLLHDMRISRDAVKTEEFTGY